MQEMLAQIAIKDAIFSSILSSIQPGSVPVMHTFEDRARIAQAFFDPLFSAKSDWNLDH